MCDIEYNIDCLRKAYLTSPKPIAAFLGAGVSAPLGLKMWGSLLNEMNERFGANININDNIANYGYAKTASKIYNFNPDYDFYIKFMDEQVTPHQGACAPLYPQIYSIFEKVFTTNYDDSLVESFNRLDNICAESGGKKKNFRLQILPSINATDLLHPTIVYLHGYKGGNCYIFREEEYKHHYPSYYDENKDTELELFLKNIFRHFHLVFIGSSFNDEHFVTLLQRSRDSFLQEVEDMKLVYQEEPRYNELPGNFVFISEKELSKSISVAELSKSLDMTIEIQELFNHITGEKLVFKDEALEMIKTKELSNKDKKVLLSFYKRSNDNRRRSEIFKELGVKVITFTEERYREIGNVLDSLKPSLDGGEIGQSDNVT